MSNYPQNPDKPLSQYPPPPGHPDFYHQYREKDPVNNSIYDIFMQPSTDRVYKNRSVMVIDSADRSNGTQSNYSYDLEYLYNDVIAVELKLADIPNSAYLINENNNNFYFQDTNEQVCNGDVYQVSIPVGNYFAESDKSLSLRKLLELGMNSASCGSKYEVDVDRHTNKFNIKQICGSGFFNVIFANDCDLKPIRNGCDFEDKPEPCQLTPNIIQNTMEVVLGFSKNNFNVLKGRCCHDNDCDNCSDEKKCYSAPTLISDLTFNLKQDKYVVLRIESDGHVWRRVISKNSNIRDAYAILPFDFPLNNFQFLSNLNNINNDVLIMEFQTPIKMQKFKITLTNHLGQEIDFNGRDHLFIFEVTSLSRVSNFHNRT
jgi:hypothetical protein